MTAGAAANVIDAMRAAGARVAAGPPARKALLSACALAAGLCIFELWPRRHTPLIAAGAVEAAPEQPVTTRRFIGPTLAASDVVVERPLFSRSRRPAQRDAASRIETAETAARNIAFRGYAFAGRARAILVIDGAAEVVAEGETVRGWRVVSITPEAVALERDGRVRRAAFQVDDATALRPARRSATQTWDTDERDDDAPISDGAAALIQN